jgi:hypothetical protein
MKTRTAVTVLVLAATALASASALALEPLKIYDKFSSPPINGDLWLYGEHSSQVKGGMLVLSQRLYGHRTSSTGTIFETFRTPMAEPSDVTEMKATITVNDLEVNACAANSSVAASRARVQGGFFNSGTPTPGDSTNDVLGQGVVIRSSDSTDPAGTYRVEGRIVLCTNASCTTGPTLKQIDLGTVTTGVPVTLEVQWDQPNHRFLFTRDAGTAMPATYTQSDVNPPGVPFKDVDVRIDVANCATTQPPTGFVQASFDNVYVNKSAAP